MFHSYHAGHASPKPVKTMQGEVGTRFCRLNRGSSFSEIRMRSTMQASAGSNHIWISSNTSARESCFPSFFLRADGIITGLLRRNTAGTLTSAVNTNERVSGRELLWKEIPAAPPPRPTPPAAKPLHRVKYTPSPDHPWRSCNWRGPSRSAARPRISRSIGVLSGSGPPPRPSASPTAPQGFAPAGTRKIKTRHKRTKFDSMKRGHFKRAMTS